MKCRGARNGVVVRQSPTRVVTVQDFEFFVSSSLDTPVLSSPLKPRTTLLMCYLVLAFLFKFVNHAEVLKKIALIK